MKIPFRTTYNYGNENVMVVGDINPEELRYNRVTKEIYLVAPDKYTIEDLDGLPWQKLKKLVIKNGGVWSSKKKAIKYLLEVDKK
jgi:hypothetical protein